MQAFYGEREKECVFAALEKNITESSRFIKERIK